MEQQPMLIIPRWMLQQQQQLVAVLFQTITTTIPVSNNYSVFEYYSGITRFVRLFKSECVIDWFIMIYVLLSNIFHTVLAKYL